jgi:opacity protein-like surface antigen
MTSRTARHAALLSGLATAGALFLVESTAYGFVGAGVEGGIIKRSASEPGNLKLGFVWGVHAELGLIPLIDLGPYYAHYSLSASDEANPLAGDAVFNVLGLRARLTIPLPGKVKPYGFVGLGYSWDNYTNDIGLDRSGHFWEIPFGGGVAYEALEVFRFSVEFALRPGFGFGGSAYDDAPRIQEPGSGWSLALGFGISF